MPLVADRVKESTTTTGTGTLTLLGAATGFTTFVAGVGSAVTVYYTIAGPSEWEVGVGTTGAGTLTRTTVLSSSNGGSLVNFSAGTKDVFCTYPAGKAVMTDDAATLANKTLTAPTITGTTTLNTVPYTFPSAQGAASTLLTNDGSGTLTWTASTLPTATRTRTAFTATASQTTFTVAYTVNQVDVFLNGVLLAAGDYTASNGTTIVLATGATSGDEVSVVTYTGTIGAPDANSLTGTTLASGVTASSLTSVGTLTALTTSGTTSLATTAGAVSVYGVAYGFPASQGAASTVLTNNGSGALTWSTVSTGQFVTVPITSSATAPYVITTADINKRLQVNAALAGYVQISTNNATFAVGDKVKVAGFGSTCQVYTSDAVDLTYNPNSNGFVFGIAIQSSDGKAILGGSMSTIGGSTRNRIGRVDTTGALDTTYDPNSNGTVNAITLQPSDGKALVGGSFTNIGGGARTFFARLNTDGTVDTTYPTPNLGGGTNVLAVAVQSDDKAIIGGDFTQVGATTRLGAARLNTNSTLDTTFVDPNLNGTPTGIAIQSDGKVIIVGGFTTAGALSTTRNRIARFDTVGGLDLTYDPNASAGTINAIALQSDGKAIVVGTFTTIGGVTRNRVARVNTDGTIDSTYNPNVNGTVNSIAIQSDGKALIGGSFTTIGGVSRIYIGRINTDGTLDTTYTANANAAPTFSIAIQSDGNALFGGSFTSINSTSRNRIARVLSSQVTVSLRAPYTLPTVQAPQYAVLTLEKASATEWWVTESNVS
jgi:uncharacterized delta-60 repeat protein